MKNILVFCVFHFVTASCFPQSFDFHKRLNKDQLKKYFSVHSHDEVPEYNLVNIRLKKSTPTPQVHKNSLFQPISEGGLFFATETIFGHSVQLQLRPNERLLAPSFRVVKIDGPETTGQELDTGNYKICHYIGSNGSIAAAVSNCGVGAAMGLSGILMLPDGSAQIQPVDPDLAEVLGLNVVPGKRSPSPHDEDLLHLVFKPKHQKRLSVPDDLWEDEQYLPPSPRSEYELDDEDVVKYLDFDDLNSLSKTKDESPKDKAEEDAMSKRQEQYAKGGKPLYLELAVFFDQKGYELFQPHVKSEEGMVDLILGFVNQMQALYQQPTLKKQIQISLVRLEMMKKQPADLPHANGDRDKLLDAFCAYQAKRNPDSDSDPNHWDLALYISGLNFYAMEKGKKNGITMGLAPVGGVCMKQHACVITEFGTTSDDGRPYPSAGLLSTYIAAHEIGHNLGMYHDGPPNNDCPSNGHVMSPSRGTKGETTWSKCSSKVLEKSEKKCLFDEPQGKPSKDRDHSKFGEKPGQVYDSYDQCKVFLRDEDATLYNETVISMVCHETLCKTPQRIGYYAAGPALEGTFCGGKKWCKGGQCVSWGSEKLKVVKGGWSDWKKGGCKSGCVKNSRAVTTDRRYCDNPKPKNTEKYCDGDNIRIHFCDDSKLCKNYVSPVDYAKQRCQEFSKHLSDVTPVGVQVKYNDKRQWQACAVYCKMKTGTWYTPRQEFNDMGIDTFFPEGTWCHNDGRTDYYCQNRLCQPPPVKGRALDPMGHGSPKGGAPEVEVPVLNNAHPRGENRSPKKLQEYFQYQEGRLSPPIPRQEELGRRKEEDYDIMDYVSPR